MKFYMAAPFNCGRGLVRHYSRLLEEAGHSITHKWWDVESPGDREEHTDEMMRGWAAGDLRGVGTADVLWVLAEKDGVGTWVELGYALGVQDFYDERPLRIIVSGPFRTIFTKLAGVQEFPTHEAALEHIKENY